jgi:hypothetical protein
VANLFLLNLKVLFLFSANFLYTVTWLTDQGPMLKIFIVALIMSGVNIGSFKN